jgi:hypothetical protein
LLEYNWTAVLFLTVLLLFAQFKTHQSVICKYIWHSTAKYSQVSSLRMPVKWHKCKEGQAGNKKGQRIALLALFELPHLPSAGPLETMTYSRTTYYHPRA